MVRKWLLLGMIAALAVPFCAAGDTVFLLNGKTVEGKIEKVDEEKLLIRTATGVVECRRDEVKYFSVVQPGPDGKPVSVNLAFKPKPIVMPFESATEHYVVKTDVAAHVATKTGKAMEHLYDAYEEIFGLKAEVQKRKTEIVIFDKQDDFTKYANSVSAKPQPGTLGFYRQASDGGTQIITYRRQTDEFGTLSTLYHEATHQFTMMVMGPEHNPPLWVNEGLAVYFENSQWDKDKFRTGVIPAKRLALLQNSLRAGKYIPLADLMKRGRDTYDALAYSEGWSLIYFFVKTDRVSFAKYFRMLKEGKDAGESFKTCFPEGIEKIERAWKTFILNLKVPPASK